MSKVQDDKLSALEALTGLTGHVNDLERTWLLATVVAPAGEALDDLWLQLFLENGATTGDINTAAYEFLAAEGYTQGHISDRWAAYWADGGGLVGVGVDNLLLDDGSAGDNFLLDDGTGNFALLI